MLKSDPPVTYVVSKNKHYICVDGVNFTQHYADVFPTGSTGKGCCMHARRAVGLFRDRYCPQGRIDEAELACSSGFRAREAGETSSRGLWLMCQSPKASWFTRLPSLHALNVVPDFTTTCDELKAGSALDGHYVALHLQLRESIRQINTWSRS